MEPSKIVQGVNSGLLAVFSAYLIGRGDIDPLVITVPAISASKYLLMSLTPDISPTTSQWAHYLAWFLTTPVMLWLIFSLNSVPVFTLVLMLLLNQLMIVAGYLASIEESDKEAWNWFAIGCFAFLPIVYELLSLTHGFALVALTLITWSLYPIIWYLSRKERITIAQRNVGYSFLDFTSKAGLVTLYLMEIGKL
jgi:sensory rhodopsin